jgi:hypothetical protein
VTSGSTLPHRVIASAPSRGRAPHNLYIIALLTAGGFAWLVALMLWIVLAQVTDYVTYDRDTATALANWIMVLLLTGAMTFIGSAVIAGIGHELRRTD